MYREKIATYKPSYFQIKYNQIIRFLIVCSALHLITLLSVGLFVIGIQELLTYTILVWDLNLYKWIFLTWIGFGVPFFAEMDAYGRFQNYKLIKDKLYEFGFDGRLVKPFMYSNCQRIAILVAANDLNCSDEVLKYFYKHGYRWYHILPDTMLKSPFILFKKAFWEKIFFTNYYQLKYFYW